MKVVGLQDVFSCGDVCSRDARKTAVIAQMHASLVAANVKKLARGQPLGTEDGAPKGMLGIATLSPVHGVFQLPFFGWVLGRRVSTMLKGKDLLWRKGFTEVGVAVPGESGETGLGWSSWAAIGGVAVAAGASVWWNYA